MSASVTTDPRRTGFRLLLTLLIAIPVAKAILADSLDPDFFWHVRVADQLLQSGIGPVPDPFSFMSNSGTWTPFSWLGELVMKWTFDAAGLRGAVGVHALCATVFYGFIAAACLRATRSAYAEPRYAATLLATAFAILLSLAFLSFRPVTMALALMSAMNWLLWRERDGLAQRAVWLLVPATVLLTNLHLYVILFIVTLWARTFGAALDAWAVDGAGWPRAKKLITLSAACSLAALCTPMLPGCIRNALWFNGEDPMVLHRLVAEILPFYDGVFGKLMLVGVIGTIAFAIRARRRLGFENLFWLLAATALLLQMGRFASVFAVVACPIAAVALPRLNEVVLARRPMHIAAALAVLLVAGRAALGFPRASTSMDEWLTRNGDADSLRYPTAAAAYVEARVPRQSGRLLNELTWGGYLIWRLGDRYQVFMDGRTLIYPADFWTTLYLGDDREKRSLLREQQADAAILPLAKSHLRTPLLQLGWREVYRDDRALVLLPPQTSASAD